MALCPYVRPFYDSLFAALEKIEVRFRSQEQDQYRAWESHRGRAALDVRSALRIDGEWFKPVVGRWIKAAATAGWRPEHEVRGRGGSCDEVDPALLVHMSGEDIDAHLRVEPGSDGVLALRTCRCPKWTGLRIEMNIDSKLALTAEESSSGFECRVCGRPWVVTQEMLDAGFDVDADSVRFKLAHADCESPGLGYGTGRVMHCLRWPLAAVSGRDTPESGGDLAPVA